MNPCAKYKTNGKYTKLTANISKLRLKYLLIGKNILGKKCVVKFNFQPKICLSGNMIGT